MPKTAVQTAQNDLPGLAEAKTDLSNPPREINPSENGLWMTPHRLAQQGNR